MIELTLTEMAVAVVVAALLLVGVFTVVSRGVRAAEERRALRRRMICRVCGHAWEDGGGEKVVGCPGCGSANRRGRDRRLG